MQVLETMTKAATYSILARGSRERAAFWLDQAVERGSARFIELARISASTADDLEQLAAETFALARAAADQIMFLSAPDADLVWTELVAQVTAAVSAGRNLGGDLTQKPLA